ncbi:MAG: Stp1/IreP family PP2C-type Ser/Thr phosphatase [Candidatus Cloacimonetes bacterium]|nr:Stp1/IreP family PP2C-type Ser/Thr phosphatase [Candidatus Cloacimonadota bacterium]
MQKNTVRLRAANISDIGKNPARTKNEDYFGHFQGDYGDLFLVCDGMGGHNGGEIASQMAVESIHRHFETGFVAGDELATISRAIELAHQQIAEKAGEDPELSEMGSTLALLLVSGGNYFVAHCGDSRVYLSRDGSLIQLTKDHSEVQMMVESGIITQEQAATHPRRNFITRALGHGSCSPELSGPHMLKQDDVFLLCSDGLTEYVSDDELHQQMEEEPQIACQNLVDMANERGGADNITIQLVEVQQCSPFSLREETPQPPKKKLIPPVALVLTLVVFIGAVFWYSKSIQSTAPLEITAVADTLAKQDKVSAKDAKKAAKAEQKRLKAEQKALAKAAKKTKGKKEAPEKALDPSQLVDVATIATELGATEAREIYLKAFNAMSNKDTQAKSLKQFKSRDGKQIIFIVPGQSIYLDSNLAVLGRAGSEELKIDEIQALLAIALVRSSGKMDLPKESWQEKLFAAGDQSVDDKTWQAALELFKKFDSTNAQMLFNNPNRLSRLRSRIKLSPYSISLN